MDENTAMYTAGLAITVIATVMLMLAVFSIDLIVMGFFGMVLMSFGRRGRIVQAKQRSTSGDASAWSCPSLSQARGE